ncbi:MAG: hypothetical protein EAZ07_01180 [Cytophagales bacterium]|nr:MAG: hypothetical protein EAZ07_01180 [Cytophagales bacterium]
MKNNCFRIIKPIVFFTIILSLTDCTPDDKKKTSPENQFDRTKLLSQASEQIIIPAYQDFQKEVTALDANINDFLNNPTIEFLEKSKTQWIKTALSWQSCNAFNFGPAKNFNFGSLLENIGTFPASSTKIENYCSTNDASLKNFNRDSRGLFGIEYLLYEENALQQFDKSNTSNVGRINYLKAISNDVKSQATKMVDEWKTYKNEFNTDNGTSSSSAITLYYNSFLICYENLKNFKIGIPSGKRAGQTSAMPQQAEGYYSVISMKLIKVNFESIIRIWKGISLSNIDGIGFEEYIRSVEGGVSLANNTSSQLQIIADKIKELENEDLEKLINSNDNRLNELYILLTNTTRYIKADLSSLLGLTITYSSGDGD